MAEYERVCPYCAKPFKASNKRKVYCTLRCNQSAYIKRRYGRDVNFKKRMRESWQKYGMGLCPKCNKNTKRKNDKVCPECQKVDIHIGSHLSSMADDDESLFGTPVGLVRMEVLMAITSHPEYTADDLIEYFKANFDAADFDLSEEEIRKIIEDIIAEGEING